MPVYIGVEEWTVELSRHFKNIINLAVRLMVVELVLLSRQSCLFY